MSGYLFDENEDCEPFPPHSRDGTSFEAAASMAGKTGTLRRRVYSALYAAPATSEELETTLRLSGNTIRPRVWELRGNPMNAPRLIRDSGTMRKTRSGRKAIVWEVIPCE